MEPSTPGGAGRAAGVGANLVLVGAGIVGLALVRRLPPAWSLCVVDTRPERASALAAIRPYAIFVAGDGTSRLVLARARIGPRTVLITATRDVAVNREVALPCRPGGGRSPPPNLRARGGAGAPAVLPGRLRGGARDRARRWLVPLGRHRRGGPPPYRCCSRCCARAARTAKPAERSCCSRRRSSTPQPSW